MMISRQDIQPLIDYQGPSVLSVYLDIDPGKSENLGTTRAYQIWLKNALRDLENQVPSVERKAFRQQAARVQTYVSNIVSDSKGLVLFAGPEVWEVYHLPVEVENRVAWGRPEVGPLLFHVYSSRPYGVILVDHERARLFLVGPDEAREQMDLVLPLDTSDWRRKDVVPPSDPSGAISTGVAGSNLDAFQHRIDAHVHRFFGQVTEWATQLIEDYQADGLILGGPEEPVAELRTMLPQEIANQVLATLSIPVEVSASQVREMTLPAVACCREEREARMVQELIDRALGQGAAVLRLAPVLEQLQAGGVHQVVMAKGCEATLLHCSQCGYATNDLSQDECPVCETKMGPSTLAALLPMLAVARGSEILIVQGEAADRLAPYDGIGAFLRY